MTKLVSALPHGEGNVLIAVIDCNKTETDHDTGDVIPHARVLWVEPVDSEDPDAAVSLLRDAHLHRTGRVLPAAELADYLARLGMDQRTGELRS